MKPCGVIPSCRWMSATRLRSACVSAASCGLFIESRSLSFIACNWRLSQLYFAASADSFWFSRTCTLGGDSCEGT
eukprot:scaffold19177_cov125-Isochrysis_galbana.AAC.1